MGGKSSAPPPPDYTGAAEASAQSSREVTEQQTWANRPDQWTPWGSTQWQNTPTWDPTTGQYVNRWSQYTNLEELPQAALDEQMKLQLERSQLAGAMTGRMWDEYGRPMDWSNLPGMAQTPDVSQGGPLETYGVDTSGLREGGQDVDPSQRYAQSAEDALYQRATSRLDPQWERARADKESALFARGLRPGDEAYDRAMNELDMAQTDAYQQAQMAATIGAGQEAQRYHGMDIQTGAYDEGRRQQQFQEAMQAQGFNNQEIARMWGAGEQQRQQMFDQQMQQAAYQNQLRQQAMAEQMQQRGFSLNEINAILHGQQVGMPGMPDFQNAQRSEPVDYLGAAELGYKGDLQTASMNNASNPMGDLFQLGGTLGGAFMMSDRRLKTNVRRIGTTPGGVNVYAFDYVWGEPSVGVMADEVPWAAVDGPGGFKMVDYARIN